MSSTVAVRLHLGPSVWLHFFNTPSGFEKCVCVCVRVLKGVKITRHGTMKWEKDVVSTGNTLLLIDLKSRLHSKLQMPPFVNALSLLSHFPSVV